jgi:putative endonuclease
VNERGTLGNGGEDIAADYLERRGYEVVERNFRCRSGELDIVARDGDTLVFCEVKTRRTDRWGAPSEAVNRGKQGRLRRLGAAWLATRGASVTDVRFDVVSVVVFDEGPVVEHLIDAF